MSYYIIHSAKGTTWRNHKYIKKVGNKYYYKNEKGELVEGDPSDNDDILTETKESTSSSSKSKKKKSTETDRIKALANKVMAGKLGQNQLRKATSSKDYIKVMNAINSKFKKPSSSGSSSKSKEKEKKTSEKKTKEKKTSEKKTTEKSNNIEKDKTNQTNQATNQVVETKNKVDTTPKTEEAKTETKSESTTPINNTVSANIKSAINSVTTITDNDSIYATKNEDGTTTVTVDFEDGTTQTFTLAQTFDVVSKTEKTKKQLAHSTFKGNGYLIHRMM